MRLCIGSSFLPGQFLCLALSFGLSSLPAGFGLGTGFGSCYLLSYQTVNLGVQFDIAFLLLLNDALNGLLLFLER